MIRSLQVSINRYNLITISIVSAVILGSILLAIKASLILLGLIIAVLVGVIVLFRPFLGLPLVIIIALLVRLDIHTGTQVDLNPTTLLIPTLLIITIVVMLGRKRLHIPKSRTTLPLILLSLASLISFLIGNATWDPSVPRASNFTLVQLAQWSIIVFSAIAFWLVFVIVQDEKELWNLTATFLIVGGSLAVLFAIPLSRSIILSKATIAIIRAPFWVLLTALAGGQLLFNRNLTGRWRFFLVASLIAVSVYALVLQRQSISNWVGAAVVISVLIWLRWPKVRWIAFMAIIILLATGILSPVVWDFAGGELEWQRSGEARLTLISRVIEDSSRNPITGLGPASYRLYGATRPLPYGRAFWETPNINSHNNYVDIYAQFGLIGLALFGWFVVEMAFIAKNLHDRCKVGFTSGYVNGMIAAGIGALVLMMLADWILPFVYNIGFPGFQASVLVWVFLGGLVALEKILPPYNLLPRRKLSLRD